MISLAKNLFLIVTIIFAIYPDYSWCQSAGACDPPCSGGKHDRCLECGSWCPPTCGDKPDTACILSCKLNSCECERGWVRAANGQCVRPSQCPKNPPVEPKCPNCSGGPNDKCVKCGTTCPATCANPAPRVCTKDCAVDVCRCNEGFVRAPNGECVRPKNCNRCNLRKK